MPTRNTVRIVVLDDDPLGGQCLHDVPELTTWEPDALTAELELSPAFLLLTNTRALSRPEAMQRAREVGSALRAAEAATGRRATPVWRSDSTLRGHFWWEMRAFDEAFRGDEGPEPAYVFIPYFGEAGRITEDETQFVITVEAALPVAQTEFARDPAFAFTQSHLPSWLEEHSAGHFRAQDVTSISLADLREGGSAGAIAILRRVEPGAAVIVNAVDDTDLDTAVAALRAVEAEGRRFLCTGAAPFVRARLGQPAHPLLTPSDLGIFVASQHAATLRHSAGGLTIVGSYVDKTTLQLAEALKDPDIVAVELPADFWSHDVTRVYAEVSDGLEAGRDVILYTSREHEPDATTAIASVLATIVSDLDVRPRYLLVKGGSTASALVTGALGVRRAVVLGQLLAGVPVWRLGDESRWPGLPFVIFAGNVGGPESLANALRTLRPSTSSG